MLSWKLFFLSFEVMELNETPFIEIKCLDDLWNEIGQPITGDGGMVFSLENSLGGGMEFGLDNEFGYVHWNDSTLSRQGIALPNQILCADFRVFALEGMEQEIYPEEILLKTEVFKILEYFFQTKFLHFDFNWEIWDKDKKVWKLFQVNNRGDLFEKA
jgi:hypothetical protein